jgi:hypothetical protein
LLGGGSDIFSTTLCKPSSFFGRARIPALHNLCRRIVKPAFVSSALRAKYASRGKNC